MLTFWEKFSHGYVHSEYGLSQIATLQASLLHLHQMLKLQPSKDGLRCFLTIPQQRYKSSSLPVGKFSWRDLCMKKVNIFILTE